MSRAKIDRTFTSNTDLETDAKFAALIASTLQSEYGHLHSAVKHLANDMGISRHTARNWYEAKNLISSRHLVLLARRSPAIRELLLQLIKNESTRRSPQASEPPAYSSGQSTPTPAGTGANVPINVPIKFGPADRNVRQRWFLEQLGANLTVGADTIAATWSVAPKTAKRDIADLVQRGMIVRIGSRKSGRYAVLPDAEGEQAVGGGVSAGTDPCS